jgi:hypothetical protein
MDEPSRDRVEPPTRDLRRTTVKPRLIVGIRYRLSAVIQLSRLVKAIRGADLVELMAEEWQKTNAQGRETLGQALGRALFDARVEGFLVPSAASRTDFSRVRRLIALIKAKRHARVIVWLWRRRGDGTELRAARSSCSIALAPAA